MMKLDNAGWPILSALVCITAAFLATKLLSRLRVFVPVLILAATLQAAQKIEVAAQIADVAAGTELPATAGKLADLKNTDLLAAPRLLVEEGVAGKIEVAQATAVPGGGATALGMTVEVKTRLTEKGNIWFSGVITDRSRSGAQKTERLEVSGFATRELYFSGWTADGGTALLRTAPATAQVIRNGKAVAQSRELVVYLSFHKVNDQGGSAPAPTQPSSAKKPAKKTARKKK